MAASWRLREANRGDAAAIAAIYAPIVAGSATSFELEPPDPKEISRRIGRIQETDPWLVLEIDEEIAGYAYSAPFRARPAYGRTRETSVYVASRFRRLGVARALMAEILRTLRAGGVRVVVAGITLPNPASVSLHEALGFSPVGTFHSVGYKFGQWHDVGFWELGLDNAPEGAVGGV